MANITDTAVNAGSFSTLVDAIKAANLIDTLKGVDSFIASASTSQAFALSIWYCRDVAQQY